MSLEIQRYLLVVAVFFDSYSYSRFLALCGVICFFLEMFWDDVGNPVLLLLLFLASKINICGVRIP